MLSNHVLKDTLEGLGQIVKTSFAAYDTDGKLISATYDDASEYDKKIRDFMDSPAQSQFQYGRHMFKIYDEHQVRMILVCNDDSEDSVVGRIAAFQIQELMIAYKERYDRDSFIKNLLLDNLLLVDVYNGAKRLGIDTEVERAVMIVEVDALNETEEFDRIRGLFPESNGNFVTSINENSIIIIANMDTIENSDELNRKAAEIIELLENGARSNVRISYGSIVSEIKDVSRSYKEASMAMDVGKIFFREEKVLAYSMLGIGRLIYQLPTPLCRMFIHEIFKKKLPSDFDEETITTINKFFENSLNVSETSRQLYIHRNTLVYRLDKIQKNTGLDLRVFEDAITFKIALMVVEYMKYMEESL